MNCRYYPKNDSKECPIEDYAIKQKIEICCQSSRQCCYSCIELCPIKKLIKK